eukprot:1157440-Pelagomonas_calceolata.AAC.1
MSKLAAVLPDHMCNKKLLAFRRTIPAPASRAALPHMGLKLSLHKPLIFTQILPGSRQRSQPSGHHALIHTDWTLVTERITGLTHVSHQLPH